MHCGSESVCISDVRNWIAIALAGGPNDNEQLSNQCRFSPNESRRSLFPALNLCLRQRSRTSVSSQYVVIGDEDDHGGQECKADVLRDGHRLRRERFAFDLFEHEEDELSAIDNGDREE